MKFSQLDIALIVLLAAGGFYVLKMRQDSSALTTQLNGWQEGYKILQEQINSK
jgi:hypothetical protein